MRHSVRLAERHQPGSCCFHNTVALKARLQRLFTEYCASNPQEQANLKRINGLKRFRASSNEQLPVIADSEMFNARTQIDRDQKLSLNERGARHQEVVKRAVRLETALRQPSS